MIFILVVGILLTANKSVVDGIPTESGASSDEYYKALCLKSFKCKLLSEAGYFESRSESDEGVAAVMFVILNRVKHPTRWPSTVAEVLSQKLQFSYKHDGQMKKGFAEKEQYDRILVIAGKVVTGVIHSPVGEATHYHTTSIKVPRWASEKRVVAVIGNHVFYE